MSEIIGGSALARLDAALARETLRLRGRYQLSLDEFRGLYVSDELVDALLAGAGSATRKDPDETPPLEPCPALAAIMARFELDETATDLLLLALAPDIDLKYPPLIAYLNDDVRRRWPTVDLARRLFGRGQALTVALAPHGPLFGSGLLLALPAAEPRSPRPLQEFCANPVLAAHLLGCPVVAPPGLALEPAGEAEMAGPLAALETVIAAGAKLLAVLTGAGADRAAAVRGLARRLGRTAIRLEFSGDAAATSLLRDGFLAARLADALLMIAPDASSLVALAPALSDLPAPIFILAPPGQSWRSALSGRAALPIDFSPPGRVERRRLWSGALGRAGLSVNPESIVEAADRFRLSARQIEAAAEGIRAVGAAPVGTAPLIAAARAQAAVDLSSLAERVALRHGWSDLVLPEGVLRQLRQFAAAIRHRERVFADWGLSGGPGLAALFGGGPGTGKTMSAGVLAQEAGLDLWRIDLSRVVSKWIGETEKHLDRIFGQASDGNVILFFDEADAMFGKRSDVKDAHDRYANIEVAYLLQRLESYEGVAILATNLSRNIDPAFSRRLHSVIDFPLPDPPLRERLWRAALPESAPLADDIDFGFLARQYDFAGGDISVAALDAAFAAAADAAQIDMRRVLQAVARQLLKQGKVPHGSEFRQYQPMPDEADSPTLRRRAAG
jgi:hypothetical protein